MHRKHQVPSSQAIAIPADWLRTGRNLDFCLLALCSCILTLLCHQTTVSFPQAGNSSSALTTPTVNTFNLDFAIKAGLFTSSHQQEEDATTPES